MTQRIGIVIGGGDCPGLNAVTRAGAKAAAKRGWEPIGFFGGYEGILDPPKYRSLNGAGLGASHQTDWTGLVAKLIQLFGLLDPKQACSRERCGLPSREVGLDNRHREGLSGCPPEVRRSIRLSRRRTT